MDEHDVAAWRALDPLTKLKYLAGAIAVSLTAYLFLWAVL